MSSAPFLPTLPDPDGIGPAVGDPNGEQLPPVATHSPLSAGGIDPVPLAPRHGMAYADDAGMEPLNTSSSALDPGDQPGIFTHDAGVRHLSVSRRVLVVDDNPDIVFSMSMLLGRMGHQVETARNGKQAVAMAEAFRPEVILMDIGMPEMNGYEAAREIRSLPWAMNVRLVAISGWGQERDIRQAHDAGFDRHVVKPVDRHTLTELLDRSSLPH